MLGGRRALGRELRHVVVPLGVLKLLGQGASSGGRGRGGGAHTKQRQLTLGAPCCQQPAPPPLRPRPDGLPCTPLIAHPRSRGEPQNHTLPAHSPACTPTADRPTTTTTTMGMPLGQAPTPHHPGTHYLVPGQPPAPEGCLGEQAGDGEHPPQPLPGVAACCCPPHQPRPAPAVHPYIATAGTRVGSLFPSGVARCSGRCGTVTQGPSMSPPTA